MLLKCASMSPWFLSNCLISAVLWECKSDRWDKLLLFFIFVELQLAFNILNNMINESIQCSSKLFDGKLAVCTIDIKEYRSIIVLT